MKTTHLFFTFIFILGYIFAQEQNIDICKHGNAKHKNYFLKQPLIEEQTWIDAVYYNIDLTFNIDPYEIEGTVTDIYKILQDGVNELVLNFNQHTQDGSDWENFSVTGQAASYTFDGDLLRITLDQTYNENDMVTVTIHYEGLPEHSGLTFVEDFYHTSYPLVISSLSEPFLARTWWPCKDIPKDKADSVDIIITVPENMLAGSNGTLISSINNGDGTATFTWEERYPITTYLVSVAIAEYSFFEETWSYEGHEMPLYFYCLPEDEADATYFFNIMPDMLTALSDRFSTYPFIEEKYGHAYFTHGGAMEHQTLSSFYNGYMTSERVYAHELAHQWFGDLVTCEGWSEIWMNEGFASYSEAIWYESNEGFERYLNHIHGYVPSTTNFAAGKIFVHDSTNISSIFSGTVYRKGMWVLHMLRNVLGNETFSNILYNYTIDERFKYKTATTEKFKNYCEEVSGQELDTFFDQWIHEYGFPIYEWNWGLIGTDTLFLVIKQSQSYSDFGHEVPYYEMPVEFSLHYSNGSYDTISVLNQAQEQETFIIPLSNTVDFVTFDPTGWILNHNSYNGNLEPDSIDDYVIVTDDFEILETYPNPFPNPGNPSLTINFRMPESGNVKLKIFNMLGQEVYYESRFFVKRQRQSFNWNGKNNGGEDMPSGIYMVHLQQKNATAATKILKLK
ncbi:MAG: T9SS type A sorting domain-containing protein [Calditrichia bacterium]|nr:T9SS type A sorting domain-containing protein [Calditrichia bacterium]